MTDTIRPYGPGKFSTILDSYVYQVSLEGGCDDEIGSVDQGENVIFNWRTTKQMLIAKAASEIRFQTRKASG